MKALCLSRELKNMKNEDPFDAGSQQQWRPDVAVELSFSKALLLDNR